jgi:hypothetical protein
MNTLALITLNWLLNRFDDYNANFKKYGGEI